MNIHNQEPRTRDRQDRRCNWYGAAPTPTGDTEVRCVFEVGHEGIHVVQHSDLPKDAVAPTGWALIGANIHNQERATE